MKAFRLKVWDVCCRLEDEDEDALAPCMLVSTLGACSSNIDQ